MNDNPITPEEVKHHEWCLANCNLIDIEGNQDNGFRKRYDVCTVAADCKLCAEYYDKPASYFED